MGYQRLSVRLLVIASVLFLAEQTYAKSTKQKLREREARMIEPPPTPGTNRPCEENEFRCEESQRCIRATWLCDGDNDCGDMSDEDSDTCHGRECGPGHLRCNSGQCVDEEAFCTLQSRGCRDGSLTPAESCESVRCPSDEMEMCPNGERCIYPSYRCDGDNDCGDMSDESIEDCPPLECPGDHFSCATVRRCVSARWLCDGDNDCGDMSDEDEDTCANFDVTCDDDQFHCQAARRCVPSSFQCDGDNDCGDMSDESLEDCPPIECRRDQFSCATVRRCVPARWLCDGDDDCRDNSDEDPDTCESFELTCDDDQFKCESQRRCVPASFVCDGDNDCGDYSDESVDICPAMECDPGYFSCATRRRCIRAAWLCDGDDDCGDMSDEDQETCDSYVLTCADDQFQCETVRRCIPDRYVCDGDNDCGDMSDEPDPSCAGQNPTQCLRAVQETCLQDIMNQYGSLSPSELWETAREADVKESCSQLIQAQDCAWQTMESLGCDMHTMPHMAMQVITIYNTTINFVCRQHQEVFEEYNDCLLSPSEDSPEPVLVQSMMSECLTAEPPMPGSSPFCSTARHECASRVVAEQCGQEIAGYLDQLNADIRNRLGCGNDQDSGDHSEDDSEDDSDDDSDEEFFPEPEKKRSLKQKSLEESPLSGVKIERIQAMKSRQLNLKAKKASFEMKKKYLKDDKKEKKSKISMKKKSFELGFDIMHKSMKYFLF